MSISMNRETGEIILDPSYETHIGKMILKNMKERGDDIHQIDVATGEQESRKSVYLKSIRVAENIQSRNLKVGDVVILYAAFHNDACVPFISSMYLGLVPLCLAIGMKHSEIKHFVTVAKPKMVFTDPNLAEEINEVLAEANVDAEIVTFGESNFTRFSDMCKPTGTEDSFQCVDFDTDKTSAFAVCSSGSTGLPKLVMGSHRAVILQHILPIMYIRNDQNPEIRFFDERYICFSSLCWVSALYGIIGSCVFGNTRIQTSGTYSAEVAVNAVLKYKPGVMMLNPVAMFRMAKYLAEKNIRLTSLYAIYCGGSAVYSDVVDDFKKYVPNAEVIVIYGSTEAGMVTYNPGFRDGNLGKIFPWVKFKVSDIDTGETLGPNKKGEMRVNSITTFQGYFNDTVSTKNAIDSEGYYKTGDLVFYDEHGYFHYVDRCKEMIKHLNFQIATNELEHVICTVSGVLSAGVVGLPDPDVGEWPLAFVELESGTKTTADDIKAVVKNSLSSYKQLKAVVIMDKLPLTHSGKIDRKALNTMKYDVKIQ